MVFALIPPVWFHTNTWQTKAFFDEPDPNGLRLTPDTEPDNTQQEQTTQTHGYGA
ncbi:MAG: hypothetical protein ABF823_03865 [Acetobacter syzygii]|uniref:hypothetical protein n=1 Tax=Acetobacter syzygii TaxID=146476 RepID=UPI0039EADC20